MEENYTRGELGEVFEHAVPLPLSVVRRILDQMYSSSNSSSGDGDNTFKMMQNCREQIKILEEGCGSEEAMESLQRVRLRLQQETNQTNAHLAFLLSQGGAEAETEKDDFGLHLDQGSSGIQRAPLKPFEIVALITVMPKTAEEAVFLIPSLSRFDPEELNKKRQRLMSEYQREDLRRLVINNLSIGCNEAIVYELVLHFGPVHRIVWPSEQSLSGEAQRKTYCFVDFFYAEDAKYCYQMLSRSGVKLLNEEIRVSHLSAELKEREQGVGPGGQGSSLARRPIGLHEIGAKVIVKGIDSQATEFEIQTYFERFGSFAVPPRLQRTATGKFRGIAILSYKDFAYSDKAIELAHDKVFKNRIISVQYAELEDGSGRLHGSEEEREKAAFIQEEERKYQALLDEKNREAEKQNRRENTSWADPFHASRQYNR